MISPRLMRAYRRTVYRVGDVEVRIGRRAPEIDLLLRHLHAREAALISAHNPRSRRMPKGWNDRMQRRLAKAVSRMPRRTATGCWRGWSEDHLLLTGSPRKAAHLARRFRQNGIVILRLGQPAGVIDTS